jgi:outer membrane protein TolC
VAEEKVEIARQQRRQVRAQLLSQAARSWWNWLIAGEKLKAYRELARHADMRRQFIQEQLAVGAVSEIELVDNERALAQRLAILTRAELEFQEKSLDLGLFRRDAQGSPVPATVAELPALPALTNEAPAMGESGAVDPSSAPQMRVFEISLRILEREIRRAKNDTLPELNFGVSGSQSFGTPRPYSPDGFSQTETKVGGKLSFSWDIQRRAARGEVAAFRARYRAVEQQRRLAEDKMELRLRAQDAALAAHHKAAQLSRQATELAGKVSDAERASFELGQSSVLAVNLREQAYIGTYLDELDAIRAFQIAWLERSELLGRTEFLEYLPPR